VRVVAVRTAVDSSVLLDVLTDARGFAERSEAALRGAAGAGALLIGECVLAEIRPTLKKGELEEFMEDWALEFVPSTRDSAILAGEMFETYLKRRASRVPRVVPDFLIGAHAVVNADRLLARDRGFYRDYFKKLVVIEP
jgi:predicted nucleic acid-binding protein